MSTFVVYAVQSTVTKATYKREHAAKAHAAKLAKRHGAEYAVATLEDYNANVVKMVERTNLLSGQKYMEASNTPGYCSPSSEAYWSM